MYVLFYGDCCLLDSTFSSGIGLHHLPTREDDRVISFPIAYTYKQFSNALVYRGDSHISWKANQRSSRLPLMPSRLPLHMVRLGLIWTNQSCPTTGPQHVTKHSWLHGCQKLVLRCFAFLQYGYRLLRFPCLKWFQTSTALAHKHTDIITLRNRSLHLMFSECHIKSFAFFSPSLLWEVHALFLYNLFTEIVYLGRLLIWLFFATWVSAFFKKTCFSSFFCSPVPSEGVRSQSR